METHAVLLVESTEGSINHGECVKLKDLACDSRTFKFLSAFDHPNPEGPTNHGGCGKLKDIVCDSRTYKFLS